MSANVNSNLANWSTTASSNRPDGTDAADIDAELRQIQAVVRKYLANKGSDIASATTVDLSTATGNYVHVTGSLGPINSFGTVSAGIRFLLVFDSTPTITHNGTSLLLPGSANIVAEAGDRAEVVSLGAGNWRCLWYQRASVNPITGIPLIAANNLSDVANASTSRANLGLSIGTDVQAYDADTLKADTADVLTAGFAGAVYDAGTKSSGTFTLDEANGNLQKCVNGGAFTLSQPSNSTTIVLQITNNGSAGTITTSGWTKVTGSFTTTDGDDFMCYSTVVGSFSHLHIQALQ